MPQSASIYFSMSLFEERDIEKTKKNRGFFVCVLLAANAARGTCMYVHQTHCNSLQHTATHRNTSQPTATHCSTPQRSATQYNALLLAAGAMRFTSMSVCSYVCLYVRTYVCMYL